jgi:uncharacterized metal-binding protein YceD (DUF177 family)
MTETSPLRFRTAALSHRKATRFHVVLSGEDRAALAAALDLQALHRLEFSGEIAPVGRNDFALTGRLEAEAVQSCVVTLAPVPARIAEDVRRTFVEDMALPEGEEIEIPEDDSLEPLPEVIDLIDVAREALALAVPPYPRAKGAELGEAVFAAPGTAPLRDADLKPFAALAALARKAPETGG